MKRFVWSIGVLAAVAVLAPRPSASQGVTSAAIAGTVTDSSGAPLAGARVVAVHGPSGTQYSAVTRADGRFTIPGMRVGGPYRVSVSVVGYRQEVQDQVNLTLGGTADLRFVLRAASLELEPIIVTATSNPVFSSERTGAATTISTNEIGHLPTISRRVEDLLRLTPQYSPMAFGFSFAGQDNRLNNMTIDGSYFNNSFGLAGQPGDRTNVAPISLDAIQQLQEEQLQVRHRSVSGIRFPGSVDPVPRARGLQPERPEQAECALQPAEFERRHPGIQLRLAGLREQAEQPEFAQLRQLELRDPGEHSLRRGRVERVDQEQHVEQLDRRVLVER